MEKLKKIKILSGVYWIEAPEADLYILCGCPADAIKHLKKQRLIIPVEKNGVSFETGPNAILLSDLLLQNEQFSNLSEFPVLHMLYKQGLIVPNHPNNSGTLPLLLGTTEQIELQKEYIYRGNYGLTTVEEMQEAGLSATEAQEQMRMKLRFAFGNIQSSDELLNGIVVQNKSTEIRNGVSIRRLAVNRFEFSYAGETVEVDLNLEKEQRYEPPYNLGFYETKREYFSVIHSGEGDGWDVSRPCMASIITFQGKIYLIDAGPNLDATLLALGIGISEIEGIFHTHAHDDHFAGLPTLLSSDHRIKYFSPPLVRASMSKKLMALTSVSEKQLDNFFEIHDLKYDEWNDIDGLEVKPILSPHPVETNTYYFRAFGPDGYRVYAHCADLTSLDVLEGMITEDSEPTGISRDFYEKIKAHYKTPAHLKKVDVGGGMIHGNADDFIDDPSHKVILSHTSEPLTPRQKYVGASANFGMADVLIPGNRDYYRETAQQYLSQYYPELPKGDLELLLNSPLRSIEAGSILFKEAVPESVNLILTGIAEMVNYENNFTRSTSSGSLIGGHGIITQTPFPGVIRAISYLHTLQIPGTIFRHVLVRNGLEKRYTQRHDYRSILQRTWLFGEGISYPVQERITHSMNLETYSTGETILQEDVAPQGLFLIESGTVKLFRQGQLFSTLSAGDIFAEKSFLFNKTSRFSVRAINDVRVYRFTDRNLLKVPLINLRLMSIHARRRRNFLFTH